MSFYGSSFSFNGISCEEYGLMLYDFNNTTQGNSQFATIDVLEDRVYQRPRSLFYGTTYKNPLEFKLVFGADEYAASRGESIDRSEMELVSSWLTGHSGYGVLTIDQPDMCDIFYKCIITNLETVEIGFDKWAFSCVVHCDSPFAYMTQQKFSCSVDGESIIVINSRSTANCPYYPIVTIQLSECGNIMIANSRDKNQPFTINNFPILNDTIFIDGSTGEITSQSGINVYRYSNFAFPRLFRGDNNLTITGSCTASFACEFPVNVGG